MAGKGHNPRRSNSHRRNQLRRRVASKRLPCALCGYPIDYGLPHGDPYAYELDEIIPVSRGGDPYDPANVQPTHMICNRRKGNRPEKHEKQRIAPLPVSRRW